LCITATSCEKDENANPNCETVVNAQGPAFIRVINEYNTTLLIYLGDWIPFGAEIRSGACEIYGIPAESGNVEISTLDGSQSREVSVNPKNGETTTITVGTDFF
jgi:hypothetical protein